MVPVTVAAGFSAAPLYVFVMFDPLGQVSVTDLGLTVIVPDAVAGPQPPSSVTDTVYG